MGSLPLLGRGVNALPRACTATVVSAKTGHTRKRLLWYTVQGSRFRWLCTSRMILAVCIWRLSSAVLIALILILAVGPAMAAFMGEDEEEGYE